MADPAQQPDNIPVHGLIYDRNGIYSWDSPFLNVFFSTEDVSAQAYIDRITPAIVENVEAQLGINEWHRNLSFVPLHLSYTALLYRLYGFHCTDCVFLGAHLEAYERGEYIDEDTYFLPPEDPEVKPEPQQVRFSSISQIFTAPTI